MIEFGSGLLGLGFERPDRPIRSMPMLVHAAESRSESNPIRIRCLSASQVDRTGVASAVASAANVAQERCATSTGSVCKVIEETNLDFTHGSL